MKSMREYLKECFSNGMEGVEHEEIAWAIEEWLSGKGMEWTMDDRAAVKDIGEDPDDYMRFTDEQELRIDQVYDAVLEMCEVLTTPPPYLNHETHEVKRTDVYEMTDIIADMLKKEGYTVYFPAHVESDDVEYITDIH